jgi:hypothetical protein
MKTPVSLGAVWVAFLAVTLLILLAPAPAQACDRSSLQVVSAQLVEGEWEVKIKVCIGAGVTGSRKGADDGTGSWGLWVEGPSPIASFEPAQLVGPYTGGALIGQILSPTSASWMIAPDLPGCNDPNGLDGPYNCKHNATTALLFANSNPRKTYTCVTSAAECGPARSECNLITMRFAQKPNALRAFGIEGAGNPVGGCYPNPDMAVVMGTDYDVDGVFDSDD